MSKSALEEFEILLANAPMAIKRYIGAQTLWFASERIITPTRELLATFHIDANFDEICRTVANNLETLASRMEEEDQNRSELLDHFRRLLAENPSDLPAPSAPSREIASGSVDVPSNADFLGDIRHMVIHALQGPAERVVTEVKGQAFALAVEGLKDIHLISGASRLRHLAADLKDPSPRSAGEIIEHVCDFMEQHKLVPSDVTITKSHDSMLPPVSGLRKVYLRQALFESIRNALSATTKAGASNCSVGAHANKRFEIVNSLSEGVSPSLYEHYKAKDWLKIEVNNPLSNSDSFTFFRHYETPDWMNSPKSKGLFILYRAMKKLNGIVVWIQSPTGHSRSITLSLYVPMANDEPQ